MYGRFWNGSFGKSAKGLKTSTVAVIDVKSKALLHKRFVLACLVVSGT